MVASYPLPPFNFFASERRIRPVWFIRHHWVWRAFWCAFRYAHSQISRDSTNLSKAQQKPEKEKPNFMTFPGEIRNQIYRNLLVTDKNTTNTPNQAYLESAEENEPIEHPPISSNTVGGEVRCQNIWTSQSRCDTAILRVNKQIYNEACPIFRNENMWILLECNKNYFGDDLRDHGFDIVLLNNGSRVINPILTINLIFPGLNRVDIVRSVALNSSSICQLQRALWTVTGIEGTLLRLDLNVNLLKSAKLEEDLMSPFCQLRGIRSVIVHGSPKYAEIIRSEVEKPYTPADIQAKLAGAISEVEKFKLQDRSEKVREPCELAIAFLADCYKVYGYFFLDPAKHWNVDSNRGF